jgi:hypothetical protein
MPKYLVAGNRFSHGHWIDGDPVDGKEQRVWAHTVHSRGEEVELSDKDAERHLADGTLAKPKDFVEEPPPSKAFDDKANDTSAPPPESGGTTGSSSGSSSGKK